MTPMTSMAKGQFAQAAFILLVTVAGMVMTLGGYLATGRPYLLWMLALGMVGALGNAFCMGLWFAERE